MSKNRFIIPCMLALLFLLPQCEKEQKRLDNYLVEFATAWKENTSYRFRLDNGRLLIPKDWEGYKGNDGQRVVINYVPLNGDTIKINRVSDIFTGGIEKNGFPEHYVKDPVKIQSVWVGGNYLNMILEVEYHSVAHKAALFRDPLSPTVDVYFSHSRENDPRGYPKMMYASFLLSSLRTNAGVSPIPFRLFIETHSGMREFRMEIK